MNEGTREWVVIASEGYPVVGKSKTVWNEALKVIKTENEQEIRRLANIVVEEAMKKHTQENTKMGYILAGIWIFLQIAIVSVVLYLS